MEYTKISNQQFVDEDFSKDGRIRERISDCRFAAIKWYEAYLEDVEFTDCKFASVNWRASTFKKVIFRNCIFDKVDFGGSEFFSGQFLSCDWQEVVFADCRIGTKKLELTGTKFGLVAGIEALKGHKLTYQQAIELLPALLQEKEIQLAEPEE